MVHIYSPTVATTCKGGHIMKITVGIDCTPTEAREFMGLPDVKPMQRDSWQTLRR